jgi:hypothetical protein
MVITPKQASAKFLADNEARIYHIFSKIVDVNRR